MLSFAAGLLLAISVNFSPPVAYEMTLAGNFGEPRPNHFHGGIDVKTDGVEGKPIYSVGDGYVSRITVGLFGFGNAVYVTHPEGVTSVYCHLRSFTPRIKTLLRRWQYEHKSYKADVRLKPLDCPVSRGQLIAVSGNTGASQAPHLHLEIHDTRTWDMLDPLDFLGSYVKDGLPPMAHSFMAYPIEGEGSFNGGGGKQSFGFTAHHLDRAFTAWGKVGFGIWANDYAESSYNRYGVRETILTADGREVFRSTVTDIPVQDNLLVNSWGDYEHYYRTGVWYMKSFTEPGNTLAVLKTDESRGIIDFNEERDYHLEYTLRDFHGNTSKYSFVVTGRKTDIPQPKAAANPRLKMRWNQTNVYSRPGLQLVIPYGMLTADMTLRPTERQRDGALSPSYSFFPRSYPLSGTGEISIAAHREVARPEKLYVVCRNGNDKFMGGEYHNGWVTAGIRELGAAYELEYDDTPPRITTVGQSAWTSTHIVRLGLEDDKSGVREYHGTIDGETVIFEEVPKSRWIACDLRDTPVKRTGKRRHLRLVATDNRDNTATFNEYIIY